MHELLKLRWINSHISSQEKKQVSPHLYQVKLENKICSCIDFHGRISIKCEYSTEFLT